MIYLPCTEISGYTPQWINLKIRDTVIPPPEIVDYLPPLFIAFIIALVIVVLKFRF